MLSLVNKYGLSHVCANPEFENIDFLRQYNYNFPYLDIYLKKENLPYDDLPDSEIFGRDCESELRTEFSRSIEFFLRGTKDKDWEFKNLFEYLFWTKSHRPGFNYLFGYS